METEPSRGRKRDPFIRLPCAWPLQDRQASGTLFHAHKSCPISACQSSLLPFPLASRLARINLKPFPSREFGSSARIVVYTKFSEPLRNRILHIHALVPKVPKRSLRLASFRAVTCFRNRAIGLHPLHPVAWDAKNIPEFTTENKPRVTQPAERTKPRVRCTLFSPSQ